MNPDVPHALSTLAFALFLAVSSWALWEVGYFGIWEAALTGGPGTLQVLFDLCVACGFGVRWVVRDARTRGHNPWPWVLAVLPLGSLPLLAYVVVRPWLPARTPTLAPVP